ncbi:MAG: hypothetical protein DLM61_07395 [Pseudonocardiales bacterium]|nr:MAG: hypothetical protein DLM61_07395 [Pseudonocardiales bacterium]
MRATATAGSGPAEDVIDCLAEDSPDGVAEPVRWSEYVPDGMLADLLAQRADTAPEHHEFEALERVGGWERVIAWAHDHARHAGSPGDERSIEARRGDALVDLVLNPIRECATEEPFVAQNCPSNTGSATGDCGSTSGSDHFEPAAATGPAGCRCECGQCPARWRGGRTALLGADELPGDLAGYGPIPAAVARDLAAGGTWRRILTDPSTGRPLDYGTTRYRPPAHLAGLVITRDQTCQFPGCRVPAHRCDIVHAIPHDPENGTGSTSEINLGPNAADTTR